MARNNNSWFEFSGINSRDMGVQLKDAHIDFSGKWRGELKEVPGRNGFIWQGENAREYFEIKRVCRVRESNKRAAKAWLMGQGRLRFSHEPDAEYDARIIRKIDFKMVCSGTDPIYEFSVVFTCQPDPYIYPPAEDFTVISTGTQIPVPEHAYSLPRITITGNGDFSLTIGMQTVYFRDVKDGIIIDSELGDALTLDGSQLANDKMDGPLFEIQPGYNAISWLTGGTDEDGNAISGTITQITITPRWRYI